MIPIASQQLPLDVVINILGNYVTVEPFKYRVELFNNAALVCKTWYDASRYLIFQNLDGRNVSDLYWIDFLLQSCRRRKGRRSNTEQQIFNYNYDRAFKNENRHFKPIILSSTKVRKLSLSFNDFRQGVFFRMDLDCAWKEWQTVCTRIISSCACIEDLDIDATGSALPLLSGQLSSAICSRERLANFKFIISPSSPRLHHKHIEDEEKSDDVEDGSDDDNDNDGNDDKGEVYDDSDVDLLDENRQYIESIEKSLCTTNANRRRWLKNVCVTIKDLVSRSDCIQNIPISCWSGEQNDVVKVDNLQLVFDLTYPSAVVGPPPGLEKSILLLRKAIFNGDGREVDYNSKSSASRFAVDKLEIHHTGSGNRALFVTMVGAALNLFGRQIKSLAIYDGSWTSSLSTCTLEPIPLSSVIPHCPNIEQIDITRSRLHAGVFLQHLTQCNDNRENTRNDNNDNNDNSYKQQQQQPNRLSTLHLSTFELDHDLRQFVHQVKRQNGALSNLSIKVKSKSSSSCFCASNHSNLRTFAKSYGITLDFM